MKRFLSVLMAIVLLASATTVAVIAQEKTGMSFSDTYYYSVNEIYDSPIMTFEAVIRIPEGYTDSVGYIMGTHGYNESFYNFNIGAKGVPHLYVRDADYNHDEYKFSSVNVATGDWVHLAIVRNVEADVMQCYVDGEYKQSIKLSGKTFIQPDAPFAIGGSYNYLNGTYFKGEINSIKLYSDVRTAKEIKSDMLYDDSDNLIARYDLSTTEPVDDTVIIDLSSNGYDATYKEVWLDEQPEVKPYDYSMIVVGDQQYLNRLYGSVGDMDTMYDHIIDFGTNADNKLEYVFNMGDITDKSTQTEWNLAAKCFDRLTDAGIDYSFVRGNHDTVDTFNANLTYAKYGEGIVDGTFCGDLTSYYREVKIGGIDYLIVVLDYGPSDEVLQWANDVVKAHPEHNVIVGTHGYAYMGDYDNLELWPSNAADVYNDGTEIWDEFISKHENISLVLCGHTLTKTVATRTDVGDNGNIVTTMLVNPQGMDNDSMYKSGYEHGSGLVAHLYFSNGGKDVQIRYYSTVLGKWSRSDSQYSIGLDVAGDSYLTGADFVK